MCSLAEGVKGGGVYSLLDGIDGGGWCSSPEKGGRVEGMFIKRFVCNVVVARQFPRI